MIFDRANRLQLTSGTTGVFLAGLLTFGTPTQLISLLSAPEIADGSAERAVQVVAVDKGSANQPIVIEFARETWSWDAPTTMTEGSDGTLKVSRKIRREELPLGEAQKLGLLSPTGNLPLGPIRLEEISDSIGDTPASSEVIRAVGDFKWHSKQEQLAELKIEEWRWLFTATGRGDKRILIELPSPPFGGRWLRELSENGGVSLPSSRFIELPVKVSGLFGLTDKQEVALKYFIAFIAFLFTAPLVVLVFKEFVLLRMRPTSADEESRKQRDADERAAVEPKAQSQQGRGPAPRKENGVSGRGHKS